MLSSMTGRQVRLNFDTPSLLTCEEIFHCVPSETGTQWEQNYCLGESQPGFWVRLGFFDNSFIGMALR